MHLHLHLYFYIHWYIYFYTFISTFFTYFIHLFVVLSILHFIHLYTFIHIHLYIYIYNGKQSVAEENIILWNIFSFSIFPLFHFSVSAYDFLSWHFNKYTWTIHKYCPTKSNKFTFSVGHKYIQKYIYKYKCKYK